MINQQRCPFCDAAAAKGCPHLALAVEGRDFVRRCVERSQGQAQWQVLCQRHRQSLRNGGSGSAVAEDFTWLETAFSDQFLKPLRWFGGLAYEWRSGARPEQGGFWVLLWSKDPQRLWWELREEFERQAFQSPTPPDSSTGLMWLMPK